MIDNMRFYHFLLLLIFLASMSCGGYHFPQHGGGGGHGHPRKHEHPRKHDHPYCHEHKKHHTHPISRDEGHQGFSLVPSMVHPSVRSSVDLPVPSLTVVPLWAQVTIVGCLDGWNGGSC